MKTKFIFIRHGESVANASDLLAGRLDLGLTDRGEYQATLVADALKDEQIDVIYASNLPRAKKTASYVAISHGMSVIEDEAFAEIYCGTLEGRPYLEEIDNPVLVGYRTDFVSGEFPGGETVKEVAVRFYEGAKRIARKHEGQTVVVGTHAAALAAFVSLVRANGVVGEMQNVEFCANCALTFVTCDNGKFTVDKYGSTDHLKGEITKFVR